MFCPYSICVSLRQADRVSFRVLLFTRPLRPPSVRGWLPSRLGSCFSFTDVLRLAFSCTLTQRPCLLPSAPPPQHAARLLRYRHPRAPAVSPILSCVPTLAPFLHIVAPGCRRPSAMPFFSFPVAFYALFHPPPHRLFVALCAVADTPLLASPLSFLLRLVYSHACLFLLCTSPDRPALANRCFRLLGSALRRYPAIPVSRTLAGLLVAPAHFFFFRAFFPPLMASFWPIFLLPCPTPAVVCTVFHLSGLYLPVFSFVSSFSAPSHPCCNVPSPLFNTTPVASLAYPPAPALHST